MDGASKGNSRETGIGGVLRDETDKILIQFSLLVSVMDANMAEIMAVRKTLQIVAALRWANRYNVIF
ncbi:Uncharacterized protein TCM_019151 [Theobroma cacao]|uniref:RNase H type-1 domain-containing protein n=1 Tax=Theobroma cacao TaxID=3641 RepID=A0A061EGC1_THECC|nr:Uncharacterized protein TCM_019151 [Theobroma cacao]